ncbi:MAG: FMN-binding protein [Oscillospiraceae bacterium]|nr:FMN-binding protein [Oscillospiraceae bacterium]
MRDILNAGVRLLLITLVAAIALAAVNIITRGPIESRRLAESESSRSKVMPDADEFELIDSSVWANGGAYGDMAEVYRATSGGETIGYTFLLNPQGYKAEIPVTIGILTDGSIVCAAIGDIQETSGLGMKIKDEPFLSQFVMLPSARVSQDVNTISGATISSRAVKTAVSDAILLFEQLNAIGEAATE